MSQQRALELLRQAAAALESNNSSVTTSDSASCTTSTASRTLATVPRTLAAVRDIFAPYPSYCSIKKRSNASTPAPTGAFWTHRFCVLGRTTDVNFIFLH